MQKEKEFQEFRLRLPAALHARVTEAAIASSNSITAEVVDRLQATFETPEHDRLDQLLDDPDLRSLAYLMVTTFRDQGQFTAEIKGHPEWTTAEWLQDSECRLAAGYAVANVLVPGLWPDPEVRAARRRRLGMPEERPDAEILEKREPELEP